MIIGVFALLDFRVCRLCFMMASKNEEAAQSPFALVKPEAPCLFSTRFKEQFENNHNRQSYYRRFFN